MPSTTPTPGGFEPELTVPLADGELRVYEPDPDEEGQSRMYVLDVLGVAVRIDLRGNGVVAHIGGDAESQQRSPVLLVTVNNRDEEEYSI